jgi:type I restriction-modification system DNA methylase subunit
MNNTTEQLGNDITNKDALRDKIHEIHNFLRNNGAGYGMNALKVFNVIYGLKKLEENNLLDKVKLKRPECEFSYLLKLANENKGEEIICIIFGTILRSIFESTIKNLLFYRIPDNIRESVITYLIKEINKITQIEKTCNVLLSGKIYEYFIGRDESAISELGAYFTDRHIVDFIYNKIKPKIEENGKVCTMIDMFGGSGGFTTGYINYINNNYTNINWETEINKIYHYDMNEDVIKSAGLEFFCLTGFIPNMDNLKYTNSFTDEFADNSNKLKKYKYVITNPPYGGDKNKQTMTQIKRDKLKTYITKEISTIIDDDELKISKKQLKNIELEEKKEKKEHDKQKVCITSCSGRLQKFALSNEKLTGNDKESCSLMLMMELLDIGGTCVGVLKEGVFFNKKYMNLRKCLIEKYNVKEIISVPQDQFENTTTKTSIIIFDNTEEKTKEIIFSELKIDKYTDDKFVKINGIVYLKENKDDIKNVYDIIISNATKEELIKNKYSLDAKNYNKTEIKINNNDYNLIKLGDICKFLPKSKRDASFGKENGKYNFYTSSDKVQKCDDCDYNEECLIIGNGGLANIKIDNIFSCSDHNFIITTNNNKYIYFLIKSNMDLLKNGFKGSTLKNISKEYLVNLQLPIPKTQEKIDEWVNKISIPYNLINNSENNINKINLEIINKIKYIEENENCDEHILNNIIDIKCGEYITKSNSNNGIYPVYGGGNISNYIDKYNRENELIINKDGVSLDCVKFEKKKFFLNHHGWTLTYKNIKFKNYIIYWLINNKEKIYNIAKGTAQKGITQEKFLNLKIKIPKNIKIIEKLEILFQKIENDRTIIQENETLYNNSLQELYNDIMQNNNIKNNNTEKNNDNIENNNIIITNNNNTENNNIIITNNKTKKINKKVNKLN